MKATDSIEDLACVRRLDAASKELELARHAEELATKRAAEEQAMREKERAGERQRVGTFRTPLRAQLPGEVFVAALNSPF